jgi:predicted nucleic acid-binding protein
VIVADASLIMCFAIGQEQADLADAIYEADNVWVVPLLWRSELRNALLKYMRHAGMSLRSGLLALQSAEEVIGGREYRVSSEKVFQLAMGSKCSASDCEYVALAMDLDVPLVTADKQILREFPAIAVSLETFARKT